MAGKVKTWVWVVLGLIVACVRRRSSRWPAPASTSSPSTSRPRTRLAGRRQREFDEIKARFSGQKPLIELDATARSSRRTPTGQPTPTAACPRQLYVLAFDPDDGRVVRSRFRSGCCV